MANDHQTASSNSAAHPPDTVGIVLAGGGATRLASVAEVSRKDSPANGTSATMPTGISKPMGGW